jgi:hypothetical protein
MAVEFDSLVGHLYIVGGRTISAPPPGMLVETAPKKTARGREMDTIFVLVLPSGEVAAPGTFYEQMAQHAAERYFNSTGSVTSGVRTVFSSLNQNLIDHNASGRRSYEANMLCAVLHGDDLFIARVGSGVALLYNQGELLPFPNTFENDDALFGPPLGIQPVPDTKMTRYRVTSGTRLIIADVGMAELSMERMTAALSVADIGEVLVGYKELVSTHISLLAIELVPPEAPTPLLVREGESTKALMSGNAPASAKIEAGPAVEEFPASRLSDATEEARIRARRGAGKAASNVAKSLDSISKKIERTQMSEEGNRGWLSAPGANTIILLIPIAIVVLVVLMWLGGTGESEFELCVNDTLDTANMARSVSSSDVNGTLAAWNAVILSVQRCNEIRPGDQQLAALTREGQIVIDRLYEIERREMTPIEAFPNATLSRIVQRGDDLYVLDDNNDLVYRVTIRNDGLGIVPSTRQAIPSMRRGAVVGQYTIGDLFDITWAEDGSGLSQGNVLIALDKSGVIVEYSPTFLARGVQRLLGTENWVNPVKAIIWQGRLYILDPAANQIWRYDPSGSAYPSAPLEYFTGQTRPNIINAVDFGIDANGRVYVLFADAVLSVFRTGVVQPFGFANFPENQPLNTVDSMFLDANPTSLKIYMVSRINKTIYETTLAGTFVNSYRAFDEEQFASLTGVVADESRRVIYTLSGNSILAFPKIVDQP